MFRSTLVEVYLFRRRARRVEVLALRRARDRTLPGVWQPVTGRREARESPFAAAAREVAEETGLEPLRWWALETITLYYDPEADAVQALPLFAAEVDATARVRLSEEHDRAAFLLPAAAARRFLWQSQRRGVLALEREVLNGGALADALEVTGRKGSARRRGSRPSSARSKPRRRP